MSQSCVKQESKNMIVDVTGPSVYGHSVGDTVTVVMGSGMARQALAYGFVAPLLILLSVFVVMHLVTENELLVASVSLISTVLYYTFLYIRRTTTNSKFSLEIAE